MYFLEYVSAEYEVYESVGNSSVGDLTDMSVGEMSGVWVKMVSTMNRNSKYHPVDPAGIAFLS